MVLIKKAIELHNIGYKLWYMDTDSLYTNARKAEFPISDKLGDWKLEHDIYKGEFYYPKTYWFVDQCGFDYIKSKGIKLDTYAEFQAYINGETMYQKDKVKVSPFKKAVKQCGSIVGYAPSSKTNKYPAPKRRDDSPLVIMESEVPDWVKTLQS